MPIVQIIFFAVTLAMPAWLWTKTKVNPNSPSSLSQPLFKETNPVPLEASEKVHNTIDSSSKKWMPQVERIIEVNGGFPDCDTTDLVRAIRQLCNRSQESYSEEQTEAYVLGSSEIVFKCEYRKSTVLISWDPEPSGRSGLSCKNPKNGLVQFSPGLNFDHKGRIHSLDFMNTNGVRESVSMRNCRAKLLATKGLVAPKTKAEFLDRLGTMTGDPQDFRRGNLMCFTFDPSSQWNFWREKYK